MKQNLSQILKGIFTSSGYRVTDSNAADLIAEKNGERMYIKFYTDIDYHSIEEFSGNIPDGTGLCVFTGDLQRNLAEEAKRKGIVVWDRDELAYQIGRAVLADLEEETAGYEDDENAYQEPDYITAEESRNPDPVFVSQPAGREETLPPQAEAARNDLKRQSVLELRSTPVNIPKEKAMSIARPHLGSVGSAELTFVPYWRYTYDLHSEYQFKSKLVEITGEGEGFINALNGNAEEFSINEIKNSIVVEDEYEIRSPTTTDPEIRESLLKKISEEHTRDVKFGNTVGEAIISEHKRFRPARGDINIATELVYIPVWEVKGKRNSLEINGTTAEILQSPSDSDVEFM
jgi:hypothetical protein